MKASRKLDPIMPIKQLPITNWHEGLGDPTIADVILDRPLERAHRIELSCNSRRRGQRHAALQEVDDTGGRMIRSTMTREEVS